MKYSWSSHAVRENASSTDHSIIILAGKHTRLDDLDAARSAVAPRIEYRELAAELGAQVMTLTEANMCEPKSLVKRLYNRSPHAGLALLGFSKRQDGMQFYATDEKIGIYLALLLLLTRRFECYHSCRS